jgi:predicted phosphodiesterase
MDQQKITWLHLSDLHFRVNEQDTFDRDIVLKSLLDDLQLLRSRSTIRIDFIVVTGDIAYSGKAEEYALARAFLDSLLASTSLSREQLFIVPGNHDVDRDTISFGAESIADRINREAASGFQRAVHKVLTTRDDRNLVFQRLQSFMQFVQGYSYKHLTYDDTGLFFVSELHIAGQRIAIIGLNSSWLSRGGKEDRNRIVVSEFQVRKALELTEDAEWRIALVHHPLEWLNDYDRETVESLLMQECHFVLHGHLHRSGATQLTTPDASAVVLGAGASYEDRFQANAYSLFELDPMQGVGKIMLRRYSNERGGGWAKDVFSYRNISDGEHSFPLPRYRNKREGQVVPPPYDRQPLSEWPFTQKPSDSRLILLDRTVTVETQLHNLISALQSSGLTTSSPTVGKLLLKANSLAHTDNEIGQIRQLVLQGSDVSIAWSVLRSIEIEVGEISDEFLDYQAGSLLRQRKIGDEICEWSDAILSEVGARTGDGWTGTSVLADRAVASQYSSLVRLAFQNADIWTIPLSIFQYAELTGFVQKQATLWSFVQPDDRVWRLLTADMFASHFGGPAYSFASAMQWFDPTRPSAQTCSGITEFLPRLRVHFIVRTLEQTGDLYGPEVVLLKGIWGIDEMDATPCQEFEELRERYEENWKELYRQFGFLGYGPAVDHMKRKANARDLAMACKSKVGVPNLGQIELIDILNAAWYTRMFYCTSDELGSVRSFYRDLLVRKISDNRREHKES